jgi:hypothetical protein
MATPPVRRCLFVLLPTLAAALLGCDRNERIPSPPPSTPRPTTLLPTSFSPDRLPADDPVPVPRGRFR